MGRNVMVGLVLAALVLAGVSVGVATYISDQSITQTASDLESKLDTASKTLSGETDTLSGQVSQLDASKLPIEAGQAVKLESADYLWVKGRLSVSPASDDAAILFSVDDASAEGGEKVVVNAPLAVNKLATMSDIKAGLIDSTGLTTSGNLSVGKDAGVGGNLAVLGSQFSIGKGLTYTEKFGLDSYDSATRKVQGGPAMVVNGTVIAKHIMTQQGGGMFVDGNFEATGNITTTNGTVSAKDVVASNLVSAKDLAATNSLTVATDKFLVDALGNVSAAGTLAAGGNATLGGTLAVADAATFGDDVSVTGDADVAGNLGVDGAADFAGNVAVTGNYATTDGNITTTNGTVSAKDVVASNLVSAKDLAATNSLTVATDKFLVDALGNVSAAGTLAAGGNATLGGTLAVADAATFGDDVSVTGDADVAGNLGVDGAADFAGNVAVTGNYATTDGNITTTNGTVSAKELVATQTLRMSSNTFVVDSLGNVTAGKFDAGGNATIGGTLTVASNTTVDGNLWVDRDLHVQDHFSVNGVITAGTLIQMGDGDFYTGHGDFRTLTGDFRTLNGEVSAADLVATNALNVAGGNFTVDASGNTAVAGNLDVAGELDVAGGKFTVDTDGNTAVAGNLSVAGDANVDGTLTVNNLTVTGTVSGLPTIRSGTGTASTGGTTVNVPGMPADAVVVATARGTDVEGLSVDVSAGSFTAYSWFGTTAINWIATW